jgi:hypothetical protein
MGVLSHLNPEAATPPAFAAFPGAKVLSLSRILDRF